MTGGAPENVSEAYSGDQFVDFCFRGEDGVNWNSVKLVFAETASDYKLVAVIHSAYTET
jgi:hypothetical protein